MSMNFIENLIRLFQPPICVSCQRRLPEDDTHTPLCERCLQRVDFLQPTATGVRAACSFVGPAQNLVHQFKYNNHKFLAKYMAQRMSRILPDHCDTPTTLLIPVPLWSARKRDRGYNQAELLALELSKLSGIPTSSNALIRIRATPTQTRLTQKQRVENVRTAFVLNPKEIQRLQETRVIVLDDVCTTGATLNECGRVLQQHPGVQSVHHLVFAQATLQD